jgi:acetylornithine deacetylase/succinyl-diaminopimelate desuccinylase-like protein
MQIKAALIGMGLLVSSGSPVPAQRSAFPVDSGFARDLMRELVAIKSISGSRETVTAANAIVARLRAAGFPEADAFVASSLDTVGNVVVRLRGKTPGTKPILLMAHLDVVPALREDWTTDPFTLTERDGWWYGRGVGDNKSGVVTIVTNFVAWKKAGWVPDRDIVAVVTGDEETLSDQIAWFASGTGRKHIGDPEFALNYDTGGGNIYDGRTAELGVQVAEKVYISYRLTVRNPGGHSSQPRDDNAIYSLARALSRLADFRFPVQVTDMTKLTLTRAAAFEPDSIARLMRAVASRPADSAAVRRLTAITRYNAQLRTTCVATRLTGGHADNALPQMAQATLNCRMMPGSDTAVVLAALKRAVADSAVHFEEVGPATLSPPSPLPPRLLAAVESVASRFWPGVVVVPVMSSGATDGAYVRNAGIPVYGMSGIFSAPGEGRAHGRDERIEVRRLMDGIAFARATIETLSRP